MKDSKRKDLIVRGFIYFMIAASTIGAGIGLGLLHAVSEDEMVRNIIVLTFSVFSICVGLAVSLEKGGLLYNNATHLGRFLIFYLAGIAFAAGSFYLPVKVWPIIIFAVALSLTSNPVIGMTSYMTILLMIALISNGQAYLFYMNLLIGLIAITMFKDIDYEFHYMGALTASGISAFVCECAFLILFENVRLSVDTFVLPMLNVFISCLFLLILLKFYSKRAVHIYRDKYQEINDPEFSLIANLKKTNTKAYYHAIHTAYFCDKIARKIHADSYLSKALGYYGRINPICGKEHLEDSIAALAPYKFPPELLCTLREICDPNDAIRKKEAVIALLADNVVSGISFLFEKDPDNQLNYEQVINHIFKKKMDSGLLDESDITLKELDIMKKIFIEENLYYDFLR